MVMVFVDHKMRSKSNFVHWKDSKILILLTKPRRRHCQQLRGTWGLRYYIEVLSVFFFSSVISVILILMCGIAVSSSRVKEAVLHGIAVPVIWPLMSNVGQYLEDFRLNSQWIHNFGQLLYDQEIGGTSNHLAFRSLYRSIRDLLTFSREGWLEVDCWCIHSF